MATKSGRRRAAAEARRAARSSALGGMTLDERLGLPGGSMSPVTGASFGKNTAAKLPKLDVRGQQLRSVGAMIGIGNQARINQLRAANHRRRMAGSVRRNSSTGLNTPRAGWKGRGAAASMELGVQPHQVASLNGIRSIGSAPRNRNKALTKLAGLSRGKKALIGAGLLGGSAIMSNTGRATDRTRGRPTGIFKY